MIKAYQSAPQHREPAREPQSPRLADLINTYGGQEIAAKPELLPFVTSEEPCRNCGGGAYQEEPDITFCSFQTCWVDNTTTTINHLKCRCKRCGYTWLTETADARN